MFSYLVDVMKLAVDGHFKWHCGNRVCKGQKYSVLRSLVSVKNGSLRLPASLGQPDLHHLLHSTTFRE
jgi:hypothetical protein